MTNGKARKGFAALLGLAIWFSPVELHAAKTACVKARSEAAKTKKLSFAKAVAAWRAIPDSEKAKIVLDVDLKRFVNPNDWEASLAAGTRPSMAYGESTTRQWLTALLFVNQNVDQLDISADSLRTIHAFALEEHYFRGYEWRRILELASKGKLTEAQVEQYKRQIYEENRRVYMSSTDHEQLLGKFRSDPLDNFFHDGEHFDKQGRRYMTEAEFAALQLNPYMTLDETQPVRKSRGKVYARFRYPDVKDVEKLTGEAIADANRALRTAKTDAAVIKIVAKLTFALINIHPFLDGNGRTVRLFADLILLSRGIPPPLFPYENELDGDLGDQVDSMRGAVVEYVEARISERGTK